MSALSRRIPWWGKIGAKIVLSRVPFGYRLWARLGAFRHGANEDAPYAFGVFSKHFELASPPAGFVTLELGPGDALASAVLTKAFGGRGSYQVDVGDFASRDVRTYVALADYCRDRGFDAPDLQAVRTREDLLQVCGATYLTEGLQSLKSIATGSVDFIYSQSCLEHVRAAEFLPIMVELRRILKPGGVASHWIDLQDHLEQALNNLRFSDELWESPFMANSGFYTNRIRFSEMVRLIQAAGFEAEVGERRHWPSLPTPRERFAHRFRELELDDLTTKGFAVRCR